MKKGITILLALFWAVSLFGQAGTQTFELSAGAMFPLSDLSDNNLADSSSGASATGYHIQIGYNYLVSDLFGLGIDVEFNDARYSMKKITKYYENFIDDASHTIESTAGWTIGGIYMRYFIHLAFGGSTFLDISPLIGAMGTYSPEYTMKTTSIIPPGPNPTHTYYRQRSKAFSFAYGVSAKLNFKVHNHGVFLEGRTIRSKVNFKQVTGTGYNGKPYNNTVKMDIMYLTASLGYTYYF
jgi:hypothetical protein